jgi:predicted dehydrogenase
MKRRTFLDKSTRAGTGLVIASGLLGRATAAPSDTVVLAVVGINGQGLSHLENFGGIRGSRVKTVVDVDERLFARTAKFASEQGFPKLVFETDLRRVLEDPEIDAVTIATPEHWHALQTIWACQAGKDVYVEKPTSHNVWESRKAVEAARRYGRIVAPGTQQRSCPHVQEAVRLLREGVIGEVFLARGLCFKPRESIGRKADSPTPPGVHYDLWLGPAELRSFNENRFHYNWHWFWEYGCGDIGNQGVHEMDTARWGLGKDTLPAKIKSSGGYWAFSSDQQTPNTQTAIFEWEDGKQLHFEVRGLYTNDENGLRIGNFFYGTKGWMHLDINGYSTFLDRKDEPGPSGKATIVTSGELVGSPAGFTESQAHASSRALHRMNFVEAVRSRDVTRLSADILEGHLSSSLCHLANIAYRLGRELQFDSHSERFVGDETANGYLTRRYRPPFVVPEKV